MQHLQKPPGGGAYSLSKDGLDFGVEGNVSDGLAANGESHPAGMGEMEKAADVVVVVIAGEEALGFGGGEMESRESHRLDKFGSKRAVSLNEFSEGHHFGWRPQSGRRSLRPRIIRRILRLRGARGHAASGFGGHGGISIFGRWPTQAVYTRQEEKFVQRMERRRLVQGINRSLS